MEAALLEVKWRCCGIGGIGATYTLTSKQVLLEPSLTGKRGRGTFVHTAKRGNVTICPPKTWDVNDFIARAASFIVITNKPKIIFINWTNIVKFQYIFLARNMIKSAFHGETILKYCNLDRKSKKWQPCYFSSTAENLKVTWQKRNLTTY